MALDLASGRRRTFADIGLLLAFVLVLSVLVIPLPALVLDLLLALSIGTSVVMLFVALQTRDPLEFSSFPTVLLLVTLFRLALNVASTRLILGNGHGGAIIQGFGKFLIGGNFAVGVVIFLILVAINFVVITKGAGRIAEVTARFTLDAMPGKQMAIDADLAAGLIDDKEAKRRREEVGRQADFYGAIDGASKFVKGDAVAAVLITAINLVGGLFIGIVQRGMSFSEAASTYTLLTVGEGLVSQVPALIISTAAGIIVTRPSGASNMGSAVAGQMAGNPLTLYAASAVLAGLGLVPGLPLLPFLLLGSALAALGGQISRMEGRQERQEKATRDAQVASAKAPQPTPPMEDLLQVDTIELEVGYAVIPLIDEGQGGDLLERIQMLRKQAALETGLLIPQIRIRDDIRLNPNDYVIKVRGAMIAKGEVMPRFFLALNTGQVSRPIDGVETIDPAFGLPAVWVAASRREEAAASGYVVVDAATMLATHMMEALKGVGDQLIGRQDVQEMITTLRKTHPALVDELVPNRISLALLHRVLQRLLRERVSIRDLVTILEAMGDGIEVTKDAEALTEMVRRALANTIGRQYADPTGQVRAITLGSRLEIALMSLFGPRTGHPTATPLTQELLTHLLRDLTEMTTRFAHDGRPAPIVTSPALRLGVRKMLEPVLPQVPVLALAELPTSLTLASVATWEIPNLSTTSRSDAIMVG